jgi:hypothetical protein
MEQAKAVEAARLLVEALRTGNPIKELPQEVRPLVAADSNQIVNEINKMLGHDIAGWKITFLYKPREVPFQAPLYSHLVFSSPAKVPVSLTPSLFIEPEITFRLTADLPPRAKLYRTWGDCFGYFSLATGAADLMLDPTLSYWDVAAIVPVVEGAGGVVTSWTGGNPLRELSMIASAGPLTPIVLALLK